MDRLGGLVVIAGPGENFSVKLLIYIYIYMLLFDLRIRREG